MSLASRKKTGKSSKQQTARKPYVSPDGWTPLDDYDPSVALAVVPHTVEGCTCPGCRRGLSTAELRAAG
ncbi:hypothetical protein [Kitasatospora sp. MBT66]|uniref:hypothetical protein n=1 Tax=Kitasatospora sp. MBT66 TaxID=1444769 RepID=UPI0005BD7961|nr:hypothetical protein [Kitasatospora sp. MBT66]